MRKIVMALTFAFVLGGGICSHASGFGAYGEFLGEYVTAGATVDGVKVNAVNYHRVTMNAMDISNPYSLALAEFMRVDPSGLAGHNEKVAFWINAYNLGAIRVVVEHYPVDSIRSTKISLLTLPWDKDAINVGGRYYSLDEIEHDILLGELGEPMAHFAIVCASVSCADLATVPYTADTVDRALEAAARAFVNNTQKGVRIDRASGVVYVSKIFDWGEKDFKKIGGVKAVIAKYLDDPSDSEYIRTGKYRLKYMDYDWGLNGR